MSLRWKLFLVLFLLTAAVTGAVLLLAEHELQGWFAAEIGKRFASQVEALKDTRNDRLKEIGETCTSLAKEPAVALMLEGKLPTTDRNAFAQRWLEMRGKRPDQPEDRANGGRPRGQRPEGTPTVPEGSADSQLVPDAAPPGRNGPGLSPEIRGLSNRIPLMGLVDLKGDMRFLGPAPNTPQARRRRNPAQLERVARSNRQEVSYVVSNDGPGGPKVTEVIVTPVSGENNCALGWFFVAVDAESPLDRLLSATKEITGFSGHTGLVVDGQWFVPGLREEERSQLGQALDDSFWENPDQREIDLPTGPVAVLASELNPDSPLDRGYQVGVFPLKTLVEVRHRVRQTVGLLGLAALVAAALAAWLLSRRLTGPVHDLLDGTRRIRAADYRTPVRPRSRDELGQLALAFNEMAADLALKDRYHETLSKVSDPAVARQLMDGDLMLGGEVRHLAVLFCDIRGFTARVEGMPPEDVIRMINTHMTAMTAIVHQSGGMVDKFVGDQIMALFGTPVSTGRHEESALRCAVAMMAERRRMNQAGPVVLEVGIGIASGEMVAGCVGAESRLNYTVLGERVNLAARLCSMAGPGEILVSWGASDSPVGTLGLPAEPVTLDVRGFTRPHEALRLRPEAG